MLACYSEPIVINEPVINQYGFVGNHEDDISYNELPMQAVGALPGKCIEHCTYIYINLSITIT